MSREVPLRRNLESLKKEAKRWLDAVRSGNLDARARYERVVPDGAPSPTLRDVQHALAREQGFDGWTALKSAIDRVAGESRHPAARALKHYEAAAEALLDAYRTGAPEALERHYAYTWHRRAWPAMRTYIQLHLDKRPAHPGDAVDISLDDARHLVALEHGFADWGALETFARSLTPGRRVTARPMRLVERRSPDDWHPVAGSRDWDEVVALLAAHPSAGLSGERQMTDALLADLPRVESLTALGLSGCGEVTDEGLRHLARLPRLEHLDLSWTGVTDAGLEVLRHLPQLKSLSLGGRRLTARGMTALTGCRALERLTLWGTPDTGDAALRSLAGTPTLRHITVAVSDAGLAALADLPVFARWHGGEATLSLVGHRLVPNHLCLRGTFTDTGMRYLQRLHGLFSLDVDDRVLALTEASLDPLVALPHLGALSIDAKDPWMSRIARLPRLRYLGIQDTSAGDEGFAALSESASIEYIWGRRCHNLRTPGFVALSRMPALRGLSVSCLNVGDEGIAALPAFPALRDLMPVDVPDAGYRHIGRCRDLESLILMYCRDTTDSATEHITGLGRLASYFNSYTTITDRTPELLAGMPSLERITFDACHGLTDAGIATLARLPRLRELRVSGRGLTAAVGHAFPPAVAVFHEPA